MKTIGDAMRSEEHEALYTQHRSKAENWLAHALTGKDEDGYPLEMTADRVVQLAQAEALLSVREGLDNVASVLSR